MKIKKPTIEEKIEVGLNILAQDLCFKDHIKKDLKNYINRFKLADVEE